MNLNNFYVLVDTEKKITIDKIQTLPQNWKNIAGLPGLSDEELCDLEWAGQHNQGWINIHSEKIKEYTSPAENLELNKNTFKLLISDLRKEKQNEPIEYNNAKLKSDTKTWYSLFLLKTKKSVNYKCINGYFTFTSLQIAEICDKLEEQIQKWFDWEMNVYQQIDSCQTIADFFSVNYFTNK
jgi:hypothetical protein